MKLKNTSHNAPNDAVSRQKVHKGTTSSLDSTPTPSGEGFPPHTSTRAYVALYPPPIRKSWIRHWTTTTMIMMVVVEVVVVVVVAVVVVAAVAAAAVVVAVAVVVVVKVKR